MATTRDLRLPGVQRLTPPDLTDALIGAPAAGADYWATVDLWAQAVLGAQEGAAGYILSGNGPGVPATFQAINIPGELRTVKVILGLPLDEPGIAYGTAAAAFAYVSANFGTDLGWIIEFSAGTHVIGGFPLVFDPPSGGTSESLLILRGQGAGSGTQIEPATYINGSIVSRQNTLIYAIEILDFTAQNSCGALGAYNSVFGTFAIPSGSGQYADLKGSIFGSVVGGGSGSYAVMDHCRIINFIRSYGGEILIQHHSRKDHTDIPTLDFHNQDGTIYIGAGCGAFNPINMGPSSTLTYLDSSGYPPTNVIYVDSAAAEIEGKIYNTIQAAVTYCVGKSQYFTIYLTPRYPGYTENVDFAGITWALSIAGLSCDSVSIENNTNPAVIWSGNILNLAAVLNIENINFAGKISNPDTNGKVKFVKCGITPPFTGFIADIPTSKNITVVLRDCLLDMESVGVLTDAGSIVAASSIYATIINTLFFGSFGLSAATNYAEIVKCTNCNLGSGDWDLDNTDINSRLTLIGCTAEADTFDLRGALGFKVYLYNTFLTGATIDPDLDILGEEPQVDYENATKKYVDDVHALSPALHAETHESGIDIRIYNNPGPVDEDGQLSYLPISSRAVDFILAVETVVPTVTLWMKVVSSIAVSTRAYLYDVHNGTLLATSNITIFSNTNYAFVTFTFPTPVTVPAGPCSLKLKNSGGPAFCVGLTDTASDPISTGWRVEGVPGSLNWVSEPRMMIGYIGEYVLATDPIAGENLSVDFTPVNYTPTADTLGGHLAGVDAALPGPPGPLGPAGTPGSAAFSWFMVY